MSAEIAEFDVATLDLSNPIAGIEEIRAVNPHRFEFEMLTAVVLIDPARKLIVGYKDLGPDEFWARGHMPGFPLMPGVIMCEAAAQMCSFHAQRHNLLNAEMVGFGGMDNVRFRGMVVPGDRLVIVAQKLQLRVGAMINCRFQCFVREQLVCEGGIRGIPIPVAALSARA